MSHSTPDLHALSDLRAAAARFFTDPAARVAPAALYGRLTREAPVLDLGPAWLVSGFDELTALTTRRELSTFPAVRGRALPMSRIPSLASWFALMFPMREGADHRRLRALAAAAFSPPRIAAMRGLIDETIDDLLARAEARGALEVVTDLALPLPVAVSCAMLDIPSADRARVHAWAMLVRGQLLRFDQDEAEIGRVEAEMADLATFVRSLCEERRRRPGEDLVSDLAAASAAGQLSDDEVVAFVLMLFVNGLETLTAALTMAIWELLQHPEERPAVAADPAHAEAMFDEVVRLHSPVRFSARCVGKDLTMGGHTMRTGDVVTLWYAAANRDARRFADPDRFDPRRGRVRHLGFGHGPHHCIGAQLSLTTGGAVLARIAREGDRFHTEVTPETLAFSPSLAFTTLESLPLHISPPRAGEGDPR